MECIGIPVFSRAVSFRENSTTEWRWLNNRKTDRGNTLSRLGCMENVRRKVSFQKLCTTGG